MALEVHSHNLMASALYGRLHSTVKDLVVSAMTGPQVVTTILTSRRLKPLAISYRANTAA